MLQAIAFWVMILSGSGLVALFVNSMWKRYIRLKALEPGLDREWVADCAAGEIAGVRCTQGYLPSRSFQIMQFC